MEMISLDCAGCGAPLKADATLQVITCSYCGVELVVRKPLVDDIPVATIVEQAPPQKQRTAYTEVADAVRSGASIASSGVEIVDKVSNVIFWTKAAIFGGLAILVLGCCGIPSYFMYSLLAENESVQDTISETSSSLREVVGGESDEVRATRKSMVEVVDKIEVKVRREGRKLSAESGTAIVNNVSDHWSRPLRYDVLEGDKFAVRSSGADGEFDNDDDVLEARSIAKWIEYADVPAPVDFEEAKAYLASGGFSRVKAAVQWLGTTSPDTASEEDRKLVVRQILPLTEQNRIVEVIQPAMIRWCRKDDEEALREMLLRTHRGNAAAAISAVMVKLDLQSSLIACINHSSSTIRKQIQHDISILDVPPMVIVDQCIVDLRDSRKEVYAVQTLAKQTIPPAEHEAVAEKLRPFIVDFRAVTRRDDYLDTIEKLGEHGHPLLILGLDSPVLKSGERLKKLGPAIEDDVLEALDGRSNIGRMNALEVLAAIGTAKSIARLEQLAERSPGMRSRTTKTIQVIESRFAEKPE